MDLQFVCRRHRLANGTDDLIHIQPLQVGWSHFLDYDQPFLTVNVDGKRCPTARP